MHNVLFQQPVLHLFLSLVESESSEALQHGLLFCWCLRALVWQEGTTLFTSVSTGNPSGPRGMDVSVRAVARLGRWGAPLLAGSVGKLIDFISVSHTTPNPYWPDIHMFTVQRIMGLPSPVYLFSSFTFSFFPFFGVSYVSHLSFFYYVLSTVYHHLHFPPPCSSLVP